MKPLPPWHSSASTTKAGARLQFQNLASGVATRARWRSASLLLHRVDGAGDAERQQRRGLAVDGEVGQDVGHHRLVGQRQAEAAPRLRVIERQRQRLAHQPGGADGEIEPRQMRVAQDLADAVALLADQPRQRVVILDLARGVGAVAALVLQALDADGVARPVRQEARHEEARHAGLRPRQREEAVATPAPRRTTCGPSAGRRALSRVVSAKRAVVCVWRRSEPPCFSVMA